MSNRHYLGRHSKFNLIVINAFLIVMLIWMLFSLLGCDAASDGVGGKKSGGAVYVSPSIDYRGRYHKGHVRKAVSTSPQALKNQARSRYYYQTRGKYRNKK